MDLKNEDARVRARSGCVPRSFDMIRFRLYGGQPASLSREGKDADYSSSRNCADFLEEIAELKAEFGERPIQEEEHIAVQYTPGTSSFCHRLMNFRNGH